MDLVPRLTFTACTGKAAAESVEFPADFPRCAMALIPKRPFCVSSRALLWIRRGAESSADHAQSRAPNSPQRRMGPQLTSNGACFRAVLLQVVPILLRTLEGATSDGVREVACAALRNACFDNATNRVQVVEVGGANILQVPCRC